ncbi:ribonuclease domain-containing protein [Paenibacillus xylaniclasticus]|uniref:ribonuclease domain-containing protein n=1 Tax=Paenibacillus xylaniclasticus TaxID=588083 RepID=UPI001FE45FF8|nr:ribonuclease domain-containing protein [Paenibacillus xylaniclasticus]
MLSFLMSQLGRRSHSWLVGTLFSLALVLAGCGIVSDDPTPAANPAPSTESSIAKQESQAPLTSFKDVSDYIRQHRTLPDNFITKKEAEQLGWVASKGNLNEVAPGKSIGGDRFGNREGLLPKSKNRIWYEADINYKKGPRGADRILYSNDGLIYMTTDHYKTFTNITEEGSVPE